LALPWPGGIVAGITKTDIDSYNTPLTTIQTLAAVGLKYKSQMQYIDTIFKSADIAFVQPEQHYQVHFSMNGLFSDSVYTIANDYYLRNISVFNKADFFLRDVNVIDPQRSVVVTPYAKMETDSGNIKYMASFTSYRILQQVDIKMPLSSYRSERRYTVTYQLRLDGKPAERLIFHGRKKQALYKDAYSYDEKKRCTGFIRYDANTNAEVFRLSYHFYSMDDLPKAEG